MMVIIPGGAWPASSSASLDVCGMRRSCAITLLYRFWEDQTMRNDAKCMILIL